MVKVRVLVEAKDVMISKVTTCMNCDSLDPYTNDYPPECILKKSFSAP